MPHPPAARLFALTACLWFGSPAIAQPSSPVTPPAQHTPASAQPATPAPQPVAQQPQPQQPSPQPAADDPAFAAFKGADTNQDGMLNREECAKLTVISARFAELDKNKDGQLSWDEFKTGYRAAP
jgi:hypothetical protein